MTPSIAIVGAGGWGTALAVTQARADRRVRLWVHEPDLAVSMTETRENSVFLPSVRIPDAVQISNSLPHVLEGAGIVIIAAPSHVFRPVMTELAPLLRPDMVFVTATKGLENQTRMRMSEVIHDVVRPAFEPRVAVISGPTFAPEVARGEPTALVVASDDAELRIRLQTELSTSRFRLYTNADVIGVEIGAATKNIIAIAAGVVSGLGLGSNVTAALITRGLAEITRLAVACGGRRETLSGLAGLGDLVLTSYGALSRNRRVGEALGQGRKLEEVLSNMRAVAEGVRTTQSAVELGRMLGVEMPIAEKMYAVLYEHLRPEDAIVDLMERRLREE